MKLHDNKEQADKNLQKRYYGGMYVSTEKKKAQCRSREL